MSRSRFTIILPKHLTLHLIVLRVLVRKLRLSLLSEGRYFVVDAGVVGDGNAFVVGAAFVEGFAYEVEFGVDLDA